MLIKSELPSEFTINGSEYRRHENGVIEQLNPGEYVYDRHYIEARYETYPKEQMTACAFLRLGLVLRSLTRRHAPNLLDYGYGNGAFLRAAMSSPHMHAHGLEVNGWPIPEGAVQVEDATVYQWDAVTFFDVAEHIPTLPTLLEKLDTETLIISLPWCHANEKGFHWFANWKHRRPGEHIWHFDADSLCKFLWEKGYIVSYVGNPEDAVRHGNGSEQNILTVVAERQ